jgi:ABC-type lipoprotein release transport system permease subunit
MPLETRIARRYLWAARKQRHTAFLSGISMLGLAVGVATLLVSIALLTGLQGQITGTADRIESADCSSSRRDRTASMMRMP